MSPASPRSRNASGSPLASKSARVASGGSRPGSRTDAEAGLDEDVRPHADRRHGEHDERKQRDRQPRPNAAHPVA
jgi:hypothetical protein